MLTVLLRGRGPHKGAPFVECDFLLASVSSRLLGVQVQLPGRHLRGACAILRCTVTQISKTLHLMSYDIHNDVHINHTML